MGDTVFSLQDLLVPPLPTQDYGLRRGRGVPVVIDAGAWHMRAGWARLQVGAGQDMEGEGARVGAAVREPEVKRRREDMGEEEGEEFDVWLEDVWAKYEQLRDKRVARQQRQ